MTNILSVIIQKLVDKIEKREYQSLHNIFNEIEIQFKNTIKYIKDTEEEITRLNKDNNRLNSELIKIQLELIEYKKKRV